MYMIVMDISKSLSAKAESFCRSVDEDGRKQKQSIDLSWIRTNGDFPLYWFGSITAAHEETPSGDHQLGQDEEVAYPPVFAIGSHRDVLDNDKRRFPDSASVKDWLKKQGQLFKQLLKNSDFKKHIVVPKKRGIGEDDDEFREMAHFFKRIFLIDNSVSGSESSCKGVREIRERVDRMTTTYWKGMKKKKKQPLYWVYLEILLFRWREFMGTVVANVEEIASLALHPKICNISDRDEVITALKYLANVGAVLFYPEVNGLDDVVFTRPMLVIKCLSAFVTAETGPYMIPEWDKLKQNGKMSNKLMKYRLERMQKSDSASSLTEENIKQIEDDNKRMVQLLELLDVITPVIGSSPPEFYVPSMLKKRFLYSPTYWERLTGSDSKPRCCTLPAPLIVIPKKLKFVPECLFFRLITRFLKVYPNKPRLSRHQCIFLVQDEDSPVQVEVELLYHNRGNWVALTIRFINAKDQKSMSKPFLSSIRNELRKQMKSVCQQGMKGFKYRICCQTKKAVRRDEEFCIDLKSLPVSFDEDCDSSPPSKLSRLDTYMYNPFGEPLAKEQEDFQMECWFEHQMSDVSSPASQNDLPGKINPSLIRAVATAVEEKWQRLAVNLERRAGATLLYKERSDDNFLRAMMVVEDWEAERGREATVDALLKACEKCGIHRDSIEAAYKKEL
ncbi:uncharacterized protein [Oscarella lobularis]|uniref:uncharacterized protein n=1 Tax=Oscarella lobularis TaxID=121494 RepID=UPI00331365AC